MTEITEQVIEPSEQTEQAEALTPFDEFENELTGTAPTEQPETVEEPKTEDVPETEDETPKYTIKVDGQEKEFKLEELIEHAQKGFDYTQKTQKLAEERKNLDKSREEFNNEATLIKLENLALQLGEVRKVPVFDVYGDMEENLRKQYSPQQVEQYLQQHELVDDSASFAIKQQEYQNWVTSYQTLEANRQRANVENQKAIESFKEEFKMTDNDVVGMINDMKNYLSYSQTKGQIPYPADTFKLFYRGKNFETLLKAEVDKVKAEYEAKYKNARKEVIDEVQKAVPKPKVVPQKVKNVKAKDWLTELEDEIPNSNY